MVDMVGVVDMAAAMAAMDVEREKPMLNQKPTLLLKLMLMPMLTMAVMDVDMVVMEADMVVTVEVMEDMVDMDTDAESEVLLLKLMLKPMPTTAMVVTDVVTEVVMEVMEDMVVDMEDMDVKGDQLNPTMDVVDMEVMEVVMDAATVEVMAAMVVTVGVVNTQLSFSKMLIHKFYKSISI